MTTLLTFAAAGLMTAAVSWAGVRRRIQLSRAKHPSFGGHARLAQHLAKLLPFYEYGEDRFFCSDDAPPDVAAKRRAGFERLSHRLWDQAPETLRLTDELESGLSDLQFTTTYRVPFQYRAYVRSHLNCFQ